MTNKDKSEIDLAKEIEELDEFLDDQEVDFPLDNDDPDFGMPIFADDSSVQKEKQATKKADRGKFVGYILFLAVLFGLSYAVYLFAPKYIQKPQLEKVSAFVSDESSDVVGDLKNMFKSYLPISDENLQNEMIENQPKDAKEPINAISELPMPSDEGLVHSKETLSIADAMDFIKEAADTINEPTVGDIQANTIIEDLENRIPNAPVVDLQALNEEIIETANKVMEMPSDKLIDIVKAAENVTTDEVAEITQEEITTTPKIKMQAVEVETKKSIPVKVVRSTTKKKASPKPYKTKDSRLDKARSLFDSRDYQGALNLYTAILQSDPANTSALTGRQLVRAKLRMNGQSQRPVVPIERKTPTRALMIEQKRVSLPIAQKQIPSSTPYKVSASGNVHALLKQAQANPNDAMLAFKVGDAYKASDKAKAMEWYRKALQIDVMNSSNLDRMAVYDAMADIQ